MVFERKYRGMYYVYYLLMSNGKVYTGSTSDLRRRFSEHKRGHVRTSGKYLPVRLIGYEAYILKSDAQRREKYLKTTEGKRYFRQQFRDIISQDKAA